MFKLRLTLLAFLVSLSFTSQADQSWKVTFNNTGPQEAIQILAKMFQMNPVNPSASCLTNAVTYRTEKSLSRSERKELISDIARLAGCNAVIYEGEAFVIQDSIIDAKPGV